MIEYIEVRGSDRDVIGIIDTAISVIWHSVYFGVGDFEIHAKATPEIVTLLQAGRYVTRPNNNDVGVIEKIYIPENIQDGMTITASGRFAKSILDRRIIYSKPFLALQNVVAATILSGNVEKAVRDVVSRNAISSLFDLRRSIPELALGELANIPLQIVDANGNAAEKQVTNENLLTYTDSVLEEYGIAAKCVLQGDKFLYTIYSGVDRSVDNTDGNDPVIFSKEFDNLTSSEYTRDDTTEKNVALIGGEGEGVDRFYTMIGEAESGLQRREIFIDASSIKKKYKDAANVEQTYTDAQYTAMLAAKGKQDIAPLVITETLNGVIDGTNGNFVYGRDFGLGDIVTVQQKEIGIYANVRIREALEYQDKDGYTVEVKYQ